MTTQVSNTQLSAAAISQLGVINQELPAWGSRRPTSYPEWVTLEVAHGGFATGRGAASFALATERKGNEGEEVQPQARTNQSFLTEAGLEELAAMLDSGRYQVDFPENSAFLVLVHLLRQDRIQDARELMQEIAPYIDDIRFYPTATSDVPTFSPYKVGVINVGSLKGMLQCVTNPTGKRGRLQECHRNGCDLYEPIQARAVKLLLATMGGRAELAPANDSLLLSVVSNQAKSDIKALAARYTTLNPNASKLVQDVAGVTKGGATSGVAVGKHTRKNATTRVLLEALCSVFDDKKEKKKNKSEPISLSAIGDRLRAVVAKRGVEGTRSHDEAYRARVELSSAVGGNNESVAKAAAKILKDEKRGDQTFINESEAAALTEKILKAAATDKNESSSNVAAARAPRLYHGASSTELPTVVASGLSRATARTIEDHVEAGIISSAEMIADVVPMLFSAAASNKIQDPILRSLYCSLAIAFSRRRSLLLVDLSSQIRLEELPWSKPILAGLGGGTSDDSDVVATIDTIRIATRAWLDNFPHTMTPNRFVSSIKAVMRGLRGAPGNGRGRGGGSGGRGGASGVMSTITNMLGMGGAAAAVQDSNPAAEIELPRLLEELASDIFMGSFSSNFSLSTLQAARALQGTIYERYYDIAPIYADIIAKIGAEAANTNGGQEGVTRMSGMLLEAASNTMPRWRVAQNATGRTNYTVENGRIIEAVMVLSTHNLCQLYAWLGLGSASPVDGGVDNMNAVRSTWKHIIGQFKSPPEDTYYGYRMVAYAWRQLLFFVSMEEKRLVKAGDATSEAEFRLKMAALCDEMEQTLAASKADAWIIERLKTKFINALRKVAVLGKTNTMDDIDLADNQKGAAHGDVVMGYYNWSMFKE